jgi:hypothetical protein
MQAKKPARNKHCLQNLLLGLHFDSEDGDVPLQGWWNSAGVKTSLQRRK